mmetsp:Transcript_22041/g.48853  ORF Transcript_22041/g.48853 Transcript_22041/m.48853 type:complete len:101 (-) Transcript_22041:141-443(-)
MTHNHPFLARQSVPQLWTSKFLARHCNPNPNPNHNASAMYRKFSAFQQQALNTSKTPTPIPIPGAALQPQPRRKKFCTVKAALNSKNTIITPNKQIVSNE